MRRAAILTAAALVLLAAAGCSSNSPSTTNSYYLSPAVLGSTSAGESLDTTTMPQTGVQNSTFPRAAFGNDPSAAQITVATGPTAISRDRAIELTNHGLGEGAQLVSAIHVTLPTAWLRGVLNDPKKAKPTSAWVVTYTAVSSRPAGGGVSRGTQGTPTATVPGSSPARMATIVIDATTGEQLFMSEYPAPK